MLFTISLMDEMDPFLNRREQRISREGSQITGQDPSTLAENCGLSLSRNQVLKSP